jgi:hypothetical protein
MALRRPHVTPPLDGEAAVSLADVLAHLRAWRLDTEATRQAIGRDRTEVAENARYLESPGAVVQYLDVFDELLGRALIDLDRVIAGLPDGVRREHLDALRQIASNAAAEQRRCLLFRDKWISRPLPFEQVRPLLNQVSTDTRDQLLDYGAMRHAAARLQGIAGSGPPGDGPQAPDRRALFTRWFGK